MIKRPHRNIMRTVLILAALGIIAAIAVSPIRKSQAQHKAEDFAQEHPVTISFTAAKEMEDVSSFASELVRLARWEESVRSRIDLTYDNYHKGNLNLVKDMSQVSGYQSKADLEKDAFAAKWKQLRMKLQQETLTGLDSIYFNAGSEIARIPKQQGVKEYYLRDRFSKLCDVISRAESGNPSELFSDYKPGWTYSSNSDDEWTIPDLLYLLWPDEIRNGYESKVQEAIDSAGQNDPNESIRNLDHALKDAKGMQERYGCIFSNREAGEKLLDDLRQKRREEAAAAEEARKKRIQEQLDKIYSSQHEYYSDPIDPDDFDIDGYYEDYRDEFDDEDDAWEGFLDDEDAWEDY